MSPARFQSIVAALGAGLLLCGSPALARAPETPRGTSVRGRVILADKSPVRGVTVMSINLESRQIWQASTDGNGEYRISGLPSGYYDFAFEDGGKLYLADGVLTLEGDIRASFELDASAPEPREWWQSGGTKKSPIFDRPPDGTARLMTEQHASFWRGRNGIAVLVAGGAAAVALALGGSSNSSSSTPSSPFTP